MGGALELEPWRRGALCAVVLVAGLSWAGKVGKPTGPEALSVFDGKGDVGAELWGPPDPTLQAQVDALLAARAPFAKALADEQLSLVLVDLADPKHLASALVRPDWETFPASLGKIAILLGVVHKARVTQQPGQLAALRPSMDKMIKMSSNEDASALFAWAGHERITEALTAHRLYEQATGGLWWTPADPYPLSPKEGLRIAATARQVARYFLLMEQGRLVSPDDSRTIKAVLRNAGLALFSKGIQKRYRDTQYYGKPGILGKQIAEGMLIESPDARYIVGIVMKGLEKDDPAFQEFGQALHALMRARARPAPPPGAEQGQAAPARATWALATVDGVLTLHRPRGAAPLSLVPEVHVRWKGAPAEAARVTRWERTRTGYRAQATTPGSRWELEAAGGALSATLTYAAAGEVEEAWLELPLAAAQVQGVDASYRRRPPPVRAGPFGPQLAFFDELAVVGQAQGFAVTATKLGGPRLRLEADSAATHPLLTWTECVREATYKPIVRRPPQRDESATPVKPGDRVTVGLRLFPEATELPLLLRYPRGFQAALAFSDHADQASATRLGALMYGQATARAPLGGRGGKRGFANRGLAMTKAVFAFDTPGYPQQLEDPRFVELLEALEEDGIEIAAHSASGDPDSPERTREGLEKVARFHPATWVDHQPTTNCEALTNSGRAETVRLLAASGYRYAWSGLEDRRQTRLNLFEPRRAEPVAAPLYRHPLTSELWLFSSRWMALDRDTFLERFSRQALDRLEAERGLHIAHTYLDIFIASSGTRLDEWTLLEKIPGGYRLTDDADELFAALQRRQRQGRLWVTSVRAVGDHLVAVAGVRWWPEPGALVLASDRAIEGLSILEPDGKVRVVDLRPGETRLAFPAVRAAPISVE